MTGGRAPVPFVPLSRQLLDSSVWETDLRVRVLWITLLMVASEPARRGTVDMTVRALAGRAAMSPEDVRFALDVLMAPDPGSRSSACDGRRLERLDEHREWGWRIVNWGQYEEDRERMLHAARQARYISGKRTAAAPQETPADSPLTVADATLTVPDVEVEDEVEDEVEKEREGGSAPPAPRRAPRKATRPTEDEWITYSRETWPDWDEADARASWASYEARGWKTPAGPVVDWKAAAKTCRYRAKRPKVAASRPAPVQIGAHAPAPPRGRTPDETSPRWVSEAYRVSLLPSRPCLSEDLEAALSSWLEGKDLPEPERWEEELERAVQEAEEHERKVAGVRPLLFPRGAR